MNFCVCWILMRDIKIDKNRAKSLLHVILSCCICVKQSSTSIFFLFYYFIRIHPSVLSFQRWCWFFFLFLFLTNTLVTFIHFIIVMLDGVLFWVFFSPLSFFFIIFHWFSCYCWMFKCLNIFNVTISFIFIFILFFMRKTCISNTHWDGYYLWKCLIQFT